MLEVADVLGLYGDAYLQKFGHAMPPSHRRALADIRHCRTEVFGGHVYDCDRCGHRQYAYHSCKNRSCPKCQGNDTELWLQKRRGELLAVPYFHVVFTLPKELHPLVRRHQKTLYGVLMKAAAGSLMKLAADPRYVGGRLGILAVLHTWTTMLGYHPHAHLLVPAVSKREPPLRQACALIRRWKRPDCRKPGQFACTLACANVSGVFSGKPTARIVPQACPIVQ